METVQDAVLGVKLLGLKAQSHPYYLGDLEEVS
jgi:hypothetical protein